MLNSSIMRSKGELLTIVLLWCCYGVTTRWSNYLSNCVCARCELGGYSDVQSCTSKVETGSQQSVYYAVAMVLLLDYQSILSNIICTRGEEC